MISHSSQGFPDSCRQSYSCFDEFRHDPASYGLAAGHADCRTCEKQVLEVLLDVLKMAPENLRCDGNQRDYRCCEDLSFNAIQVNYMQRNYMIHLSIFVWRSGTSSGDALILFF
jgi:hypothetical protein